MQAIKISFISSQKHLFKQIPKYVFQFFPLTLNGQLQICGDFTENVKRPKIATALTNERKYFASEPVIPSFYSRTCIHLLYKTFNENLFETDFITSVQHMPIDPNLMDMLLRLVLKTRPKNNSRKIKRNYNEIKK